MMTNATFDIDRLIRFGMDRGLLDREDELFARNLLLDACRLAAPEPFEPDQNPLPETLTPILTALSGVAVDRGIIDDTLDARDRYAARLAGLITPNPSVIRDKFYALYEAHGARVATDWFYRMCRDCDYIKVDQIAKNVLFKSPSPYGELVITINLSKPEKDPRDIAAALNAPKVSYPTCMLCIENPGYAGRANYPARQNHRMIPLELNEQKWHLQYSPYLYYDEHCILLNDLHTPMHIDRGNMENMLSFVDKFPHYFIGSNADLPIVGGSILTHDHFQGGRYVFPMDKAAALCELKAPVEGVKAEIANWPMSCIRLESDDKEKLLELADQMLQAWRQYSDPDCDILAHTDAPHNTITPTARKHGSAYQMNLVLRNNRTTAEHPMGIFHPHADLHHVKKENIGLIEVMGLFILPGRLLTELDMLADYLTGAKDIGVAPDESDPLHKHYEWVQQIASVHGTALSKDHAEKTIREALAKKCTRVLEDAGVYKLDDKGQKGLLKFLCGIGYTRRGDL